MKRLATVFFELGEYQLEAGLFEESVAEFGKLGFSNDCSLEQSETAPNASTCRSEIPRPPKEVLADNQQTSCRNVKPMPRVLTV